MRLDLTPLGGFAGELLTPYDPAYEGARVLFNTRVRTRPALIARCADAQDVAAAIKFARDENLPIAVRGGGHHASGLSLVEGGVVVDVHGLGQIDFDPEARTVTVGPGVGWRELDRVTYANHAFEQDGIQYGLAGPGGECPTVSNAGYTLGGGYGPLGRTFGLGLDHLLEVELVNAEGETLVANEQEHADLFWALRGAGGAGFGVVTSLKYRLNPLPKTVFGGWAAWPISRAKEVFAAYRDMYADRSDERLALCLLLTTEPYPEGEPVVALYGLYVGEAAEGAAAVEQAIGGLGEPSFGGFGETGYLDLMTVMGEEIVYGLQSKWLGGYFSEQGFAEAAFDVLVEGFRRAPSGFSMVRFDLLAGGAIARVPAGATAFVHRDSLHYVSAIAQWQGDEETDANVAWIDDFHEALRPHLNGEVYQNYADRDLQDWPTAYYGANYARLQQVKAAYDPQDVFHHPQSIRLP
ncbi:FAD-binding oxidoreductase [Dactylosporangium sp. CS-033363]|uniref:FAD-binding oxidoreductase n=1 Tax=Dactylosporangium sp. CS-033363 TaxID=3239935 RepID=UPI003D8B3A33